MHAFMDLWLLVIRRVVCQYLQALDPTYWLFQLEVRLFFFQTHMLAKVAQIAYYGDSLAGGNWVHSSAGQAY